MSEFVSMRPFHIRSSKNDYEKRVDITSKRRFFMLLVLISWALAIYTKIIVLMTEYIPITQYMPYFYISDKNNLGWIAAKTLCIID